MNFCSDKRLDSIFSLLSDPVVHCERVASVQTPSISRAGGPLVTSPSQYTKYKYNANREASACSKRDAIPSYHHDGSRTRFHPPPCRNGICLVFWCRTGGRRVSHAPSPPPGTRAADQAVLYRGWRDHCRTTATLQLQCVLPADVSAVSRACSTHWCWLLAWLETVSPGAAAHPSAEISSPVRTRSPHVATHVIRRLAKTICTH